MWKVDLNIFIYAMYIQAILVVITVIATYILYFIYKGRKTSKNKYVAQIKTYLLAISDSKQPKKPAFNKRWKKLEYLVLAIQETDKTKGKSSKSWQQQKLDFVKQHMLPIARRSAKKTRWFSRFLAAKSFAMYALAEDEDFVAKLIQDRKPVVSMEAIHAVVHIPTKSLLNILIDKTATLRRKSYDLYLEPFKHLPESTREIIVERLKSKKNAYIRDICYRILMFFKPQPLADLARKDVKSETIELCLSAIHFIAYSEGKKALPFLHQMLEDKRWQVKVAVLQALGDLRDASSVSFINKSLESPEWWVKTNATNTLKLIGEEGIQK